MTIHSLSSSAGLLRAVAFSLLFHGLVLMQSRFSMPALPAASGLYATLQAVGQHSTPDHAPAARHGTVERQIIAPAAARPAAAVAPEVGSAAGNPAMPVAGAVSTAVSTDNAGSVDAAGLRAYRMALAGELRRFKPDLAGARAAWSGTAEIEIRLGANGALESARVVGSSGNAELDDAALQMVRNAAPYVAVPAALLGQPFSTTLSIEFSPDQ